MAGKKKDRRRGENGAPKVYSAAYVFPNGDKYEGEYIITDKGSLERCGTGKHMGVDGTVYDGQWSGDKMNGLGKLFHSSGARYEGNFVSNQFHGNGRYTWPNGSFFEGQFIENRLEGVGEFTDTMSQQWTGNFHYKAAPGLRFKLNLD